MPVQFSIPDAPKRYSVAMDYFRGVDMMNAPTNVASSRSPECPNMIRSDVGKVRKRMGFHTTDTFSDGAINGVWVLRGGAREVVKWWPDGQTLVHVGKSLYARDYEEGRDILNSIGDGEDEETDPGGGGATGGEDQAELFAIGTGGDERPEVPPNWEEDGFKEVNVPDRQPGWTSTWRKVGDGILQDTRSWGVQFQGKFYILDGENIWVWDGKTVKSITEYATVPTIIAARSPSNGGGTRLNSFNLLGTDWFEQFKYEAGAKTYILSTPGLEAVVSVETLFGSEWITLQESQYTVDLEAGTVKLHETPDEPPLGQDNVRIRCRKDREQQSRITHCRFGILYGVNGAQDRLFLSGNPEYPSRDFYSEYNDLAYFADDAYCEAGQDEGEIVGYSVVSGLLAVHRKYGRDDRNIIVRSGALDSEGKAVFKTENSIQGAGAVSSWAFASLDGEPLFLTDQGVYAITARELTGERYGQSRSFYILPALTASRTLAEDSAVIWKDFYVLADQGRLYLLDGLQKAYSRDEPNSAYQYECYYFTGIPARVLWVEDGKLCFGTEDGRLCAFYTDPEDRNSYSDNGAAIDAWWDTPDLDGGGFWRNKTFRYIACRLAAALYTGVTIWAQTKGVWRQVYTDRGKAWCFDWNYVDMEHFTFNSDRTPHTLGGKIKLKKVDKVRFRFRNDKLDESFGLYAVGVEYTEPGTRYKG